MLKEFKEFAVKGNMVDLAVAVVIGGAFGKIVTSFVNDIIMPPLGVLMGGVNFSDLKLVLKAAVGEATPAVTMNYGAWINTIIDFVIVALVIFLVVKALNAAKKKEAEVPAAPPAPSKEETLLTEIRDLLAKK